LLSPKNHPVIIAAAIEGDGKFDKPMLYKFNVIFSTQTQDEQCQRHCLKKLARLIFKK